MGVRTAAARGASERRARWRYGITRCSLFGPKWQHGQMATCGRCSKPTTRKVVVAGHVSPLTVFASRRHRRGRPVAGIANSRSAPAGAELYEFVRVSQNSEERIIRHGAARFTLRPAQFDWEFLSVDGTVRDSGLDTCR